MEKKISSLGLRVQNTKEYLGADIKNDEGFYVDGLAMFAAKFLAMMDDMRKQEYLHSQSRIKQLKACWIERRNVLRVLLMQLHDVSRKRMKYYSNTSTYEQICGGFSLILTHLSVAISTKAEIFFHRNNFIAISTIQVCMETSNKLSLHVSPPSISVNPMHRCNYYKLSSQ
jgi:predicted NodU family carbamoyl transferase